METSVGNGRSFLLSQKRNFSKVINRAMIACENSGHDIFSDFVEVNKIVEAGATSKSIKDYELTRYACYLIVQKHRCYSKRKV
jgi:DNA-damage-inducible protein D